MRFPARWFLEISTVAVNAFEDNTLDLMLLKILRYRLLTTLPGPNNHPKR